MRDLATRVAAQNSSLASCNNCCKELQCRIVLWQFPTTVVRSCNNELHHRIVPWRVATPIVKSFKNYLGFVATTLQQMSSQSCNNY
jgi:hypothetical protein